MKESEKSKLKMGEISEFNLCCIFTFPMAAVISGMVTGFPLSPLFVLLIYFVIMGAFEFYVENKYKD